LLYRNIRSKKHLQDCNHIALRARVGNTKIVERTRGFQLAFLENFLFFKDAILIDTAASLF
jgi:hypothetical protein